MTVGTRRRSRTTAHSRPAGARLFGSVRTTDRTFLIIVFWINILAIMLRKRLMPNPIAIVFLIAGLVLTSCNNSNSNSVSSSSSPPEQPSPVSTPKMGFEADLDYVRKGQYTYVWVFARKDGKPLDT